MKATAAKKTWTSPSFPNMRKQLAELLRCTPQAITGNTIPEGFARLWRSFSPSERMFVWLAAVVNVDVRHKGQTDAAGTPVSVPEKQTRRAIRRLTRTKGTTR